MDASRYTLRLHKDFPGKGWLLELHMMDSDEDDAPDIDAVDTDMPRVSRNITDGAMIVLLAMQKGANGKYRYSANAIHTLVGGDRNAVLAKIKELRAAPAPAEYMQPDGSKVAPSYPITGPRSA